MDPVTLALVNSQKGKANGIATLNEFGLHVPAQMPAWFGSFPRTDRWTFPVGSPTTLTMELNRMYAHPVVVMRDCSVKMIACAVSSAGGTGAVVRLGIYKERDRDSQTSQNRVTVDLVLDAGTVDATTTGVKQIAIDPAVELEAGVYWLAAVAQGSPSPAPTVRAITGFNPMIYAGSFGDTSSQGVVGLRGNVNTVPGDLPSNNAGGSTVLHLPTPIVPLVGVQFA